MCMVARPLSPLSLVYQSSSLTRLHWSSLTTALSAKMANMRNAEATVKVEPVVNYKQITQKFLATGVNTHVHVSAAVKAEVAVRDGQYTV